MIYNQKKTVRGLILTAIRIPGQFSDRMEERHETCAKNGNGGSK